MCPHLVAIAVVVLLAAGPPDLPTISKESYQRAVTADVARLRKHLETCEADAKEARRFGPTAKAMSGMLTRYAVALGDDALKSQAIRVGRVIDAADWKTAIAEAKELTAPKADAAVLKMPLPELPLDVVSSPFRGGKFGGLDIERDIRDFATGKRETKPEVVELLAVRTAAVADMHPDEQPATPGTDRRPASWREGVRTMRSLSREMAVEAAKGDGANADDLKRLLKNLDASCSKCHFVGRD